MRKCKLGKKGEMLRLFVRVAQENDCYTMHDLCRKVGIPYEQVQRWERNDYQWADVLDTCRERCSDNVEIAAMMKRMKLKDALKYMNNTELPF
jgi:hypothetical protein